MKVVLDFERLKYPQTGLGQFSLGLGRALNRRVLNRPEPNGSDSKKIKEEEPRVAFMLPSTQFTLIEGEKIKTHWRRYLFFPGYEADLWHLTHQDPKVIPSRAPYVLTIHDLNFLRENKASHRVKIKKKKLQMLISGAAAVTYISNFVKQDVHEHFRISTQEFVIYNGLTEFSAAISPQGFPQLEGRRFVLAIGALLPKKNFHVLIEFIKDLPEYQLVIAGGGSPDYTQKINDLIEKHGLQDRVHLLGAVSDSQRLWLYAHMTALLHPSLAEGFGLPIVEAMSFGKPVFCSRRTSLPEVAGDLGFYFDNFAAEDMVGVFKNNITKVDEAYRLKLKTWSQGFSWDRSAGEYLEVYKKCLSKIS